MKDKFRPDYYKCNNHDLWWFFNKGLLTKEEFIGFLKGNIFKYIVRFQGKNGAEDVHKAIKYCEQLEEIAKTPLEVQNKSQDTKLFFIKGNPEKEKQFSKSKKRKCLGKVLCSGTMMGCLLLLFKTLKKHHE